MYHSIHTLTTTHPKDFAASSLSLTPILPLQLALSRSKHLQSKPRNMSSHKSTSERSKTVDSSRSEYRPRPGADDSQPRDGSCRSCNYQVPCPSTKSFVRRNASCYQRARETNVLIAISKTQKEPWPETALLSCTNVSAASPYVFRFNRTTQCLLQELMLCPT